MTSKRFYLSAKIEERRPLAFGFSVLQHVNGQLQIPNIVYTRTCTVETSRDRQARDDNNRETPHINTKPFFVARDFEAGGK